MKVTLGKSDTNLKTNKVSGSLIEVSAFSATSTVKVEYSKSHRKANQESSRGLSAVTGPQSHRDAVGISLRTAVTALFFFFC